MAAPPTAPGMWEAWEWEVSSVAKLPAIRAELRVGAYLAERRQQRLGAVDDRLILVVD